MKRLVHFFQSETVLVISGIAALISTFFIRPSLTYLDYVDFQVLVILFCLMAVVAGLERIGLFAMCAQRLMERTKSTKGLSVVLVLLCFFSSMFITNDVALLTFVPMAIAILQRFGQKRLIFVVALQTVAANLGSMLMPTGNPQNLYLYSYYNFSMANFLKVTAPITLISLVFITIH